MHAATASDRPQSPLGAGAPPTRRAPAELLPPALLQRVFARLPTEDRFALLATCKRWREAALAPHLWRELLPTTPFDFDEILRAARRLPPASVRQLDLTACRDLPAEAAAAELARCEAMAQLESLALALLCRADQLPAYGALLTALLAGLPALAGLRLGSEAAEPAAARGTRSEEAAALAFALERKRGPPLRRLEVHCVLDAHALPLRRLRCLEAASLRVRPGPTPPAGSSPLQALAACCPALSSLRLLQSGDDGDAYAAAACEDLGGALARGGLANLTALELAYPLEDGPVAELLSGPHAPPLVRLSLRSARLRSVCLLGHPTLEHFEVEGYSLRTVTLRGCRRLASARAAAGPRPGADRAMVTVADCPALARLHLSGSLWLCPLEAVPSLEDVAVPSLDHDCLKALQPAAPGLRRASLSSDVHPGALSLLACPAFPRLEALAISGATLKGPLVQVASERLRELRLESAALDAGARLAIRCPALLRLRLASAVPASLEIQAPSLRALELCDLPAAALGDGGLAAALAGLPRLRRLRLAGLPGLWDPSEALAAARRLDSLELEDLPGLDPALSLGQAWARVARRVAVRRCPTLTALALDLGAAGDALEAAGLPALASLAARGAALRTLVLQDLPALRRAALDCPLLSSVRCFGVGPPISHGACRPDCICTRAHTLGSGACSCFHEGAPFPPAVFAPGPEGRAALGRHAAWRPRAADVALAAAAAGREQLASLRPELARLQRLLSEFPDDPAALAARHALAARVGRRLAALHRARREGAEGGAEMAAAGPFESLEELETAMRVAEEASEEAAAE